MAVETKAGGAKPKRTPKPTAPDGDRRRRRLVTPEGVDLRLELADASQRAGAFLIDVAIIVGVLIGLTILVSIVGFYTKLEAIGALMVIWLLLFFVLRNGYFITFELRAGGATPGKRAMGLRVATRDGGRLTANAVVARNAMREIEIFLPLSFLFAGPSEQVDGWIVLLGLVWSGIFLLFPLFNRDRLRVGDLVAGTWVIRAPKHRLAPDMAGDGVSDSRMVFTPAQVDAYGVMELQVLEDVLRRADRAVMKAVAERIRAKIEWTAASDETDREFLNAYYTALRRRLEQGLLFGRRRKDKHDKP